jgi:hypothetical protein
MLECDWIRLVEDRVQWWTLVKKIMSVRARWKRGSSQGLCCHGVCYLFSFLIKKYEVFAFCVAPTLATAVYRCLAEKQPGAE